MFVVMAYDVDAKRVKKVHSISQKYLIQVQQSLFQGNLSVKQLQRLQNELSMVLNSDTDKVIFYKSADNMLVEIDQFGASCDEEMIL